MPNAMPAASVQTGGEHSDIFDLAPISMWIEDLGALKLRFDAWRDEGVSDFRAFLVADPSRILECMSSIRVVDVNSRTLELYEAKDRFQLLSRLDEVFRVDMIDRFVEELGHLWDGRLEFASQSVNNTLSGRTIDVLVHGRILPGHEDDWSRMLVTIEDITEREQARRALMAAEVRARGLFEDSPVSLWVEDFSGVKAVIEAARAAGVDDFAAHFDAHPEIVDACFAAVRVVDVNQQTLALFGASSREQLLDLNGVGAEGLRASFRERLVALSLGRGFAGTEVVAHTFAGEELHLVMQLSIRPEYRETWELVQVAYVDITARRRAEARLEFLGRHDSLTKLANRSWWSEELARLERERIEPVSIVIADVNCLKQVNDDHGHAAGDELLCRAADAIRAAVGATGLVARIGGDELAVLLPGVDAAGVERILAEIDAAVADRNRVDGVVLSFAIGSATFVSGERLEDTVRRADALMYEAKRRHHQASGTTPR